VASSCVRHLLCVSEVWSLVAPLRHTDGYRECLFIGIDRKWLAHGLNDMMDPCRTLIPRTPCRSDQDHSAGATTADDGIRFGMCRNSAQTIAAIIPSKASP
jgi:hypothetical protein